MANLEKIYEDLYDRYIADPDNLEKEISAVAGDAANQVFLGRDTITFQFCDNVFIARLTEDIKRFSRVIRVVISNESSRQIAGDRYVPYTLEAEIDNNLSARENYRTIFEAFLRHVCGAIKPEVLE